MKNSVLAYVIASYFGGLAMFFTGESHVPIGQLAFLASPALPMIFFVGFFSAPSKVFVYQSVAFVVITLCGYKILRINKKTDKM